MAKNVTQDELDLYNSYDIVEPNGDFNVKSYQKWFKQVVKQETKGERKLSAVTKAIEHANNVSIEAIKESNIKEDTKVTNGAFSKRELIQFIADSVDVEDLMIETKEMIKEIINDDNKEKDNIDENPIKEEKKELIKNLIVPLLLKCNVENELPKNIKDDITLFLENEGLAKEDIDEVLEYDDSSEVDIKKNKPYNPYTDWKYIYYMWTLGHDYSRFLFGTPKQLEQNKIGYGLDDKKNDGIKSLKKKHLSPEIDAEYKALNRTYGLRIDLDELFDNIIKDNYKDYFEKLIKESYIAVKSNVFDTVEFIKNIEKLCSSVAEKEHIENYEPYGGMDNNRIGNLLKELREPDYNYTVKAQNALIAKFGNPEKADPNKVGEFVENSFRVKYAEAELNPRKYKDLMSEAIALYKVAKTIHNARSIAFRVFGRSAYNKENTSLKNIEVLINKEIAPEKRAVIEKALNDEIIYKNGYKEELDRINNFALDMAGASYVIIDNKQEKTSIEVDFDNEKEKIVDIETPQEEIIKENVE